MNITLILLPLMVLCGCGARQIEGRFDRMVSFPTKTTPKVVETEVDIHFGPGPKDSGSKTEEPPPKDSPKDVFPEEKESAKGWWETL